ncbi:methyl-accepting chemotaxis protein [Marinimicrobium sp. C6131]|uniref:methyl-accepting chemotaxis protein n=1 Tax=Marinimicrobium sp. C6131 TaxID=3022676 RepID=UPI00223D6CE2|nr:methyl-accepting chemotaxis protein [Marinimicrobium sp. C6131]UZJ45969.1 methyl-accepting chemotaxis protein [Marinimicrobium sp. C6131]
MSLRSTRMNLSGAERRWLNWFGATGKLRMGWSCWLNRNRYALMEQAFESVAQTRINILNQWVDGQWEQMVSLAASVEQDPARWDTLLPQQLQRWVDASELFVVDDTGKVLASSYRARVGARDLDARALEEGLKGAFLHGPYVDRATLDIGPSSSRFHDEVTLMFYQPVALADGAIGCVCARVPNDVLGDLIQREAGHIFTESGDNYLFMVEPGFDRRIVPGTALSRSRFEDSTFSHGENLKSGIHTDWGVVGVKRHTEFEIRFTDPATGQLHPGVRETIRNGENLFVTYPGYSDYRHIPVIGKGVTFTLKGSKDRWGMMCEGDLEEVYRFRSITYRFMGLLLLPLLLVFGGNMTLHAWSEWPLWSINLATAGALAVGAWSFLMRGPRRLARRLGKMTEIIHALGEGGGNLKQRLDTRKLVADETGDLGRWANSFIDNLDGIIGSVIRSANEVKQNSEQMLQRNDSANATMTQVTAAMEQMLSLLEEQIGEISNASGTATEMKQVMESVVQEARAQFESASSGTQAIRDAVENSARTIHQLNERTREIGGMVSLISNITSQTNLLALNAAIEAARAGEHGRGFSVVADEVRGLAARTADAAKEIEQQIATIQEEAAQAATFMERSVADVDRGLQLASDASSDNSELHGIVERMFEIIRHIEAHSQEHGQQTREVVGASNDMRHVIRALHGSSDRLRSTASNLHHLTSAFQVSG